MLKEEAKAVEEVARTTGKAIDAAKDTGRALNAILGDAFRELGGIAADWARYLRFRNALLIADKTTSILEARRLTGPLLSLPPGLTLPLLEAASLESDDEIQNLWAALIANAADPSKAFTLRKVYVEILKGLEPLDAKILEYLADPSLEETYSLLAKETLNASTLASRVLADVEQVKISLQTLARFGCVIDSWEQTIENLDRGYSGFRVNNPKSNFRLSHLGIQLVRATSRVA